MLYSLVRNSCKIILLLFFGFKASNTECVPKKGSFIIASNHVSHFDPPAVAAGCPREITFLAKEELFGNWFSSWFMTNIRCVPLRRSKTDLRAIRIALNVLKSQPIGIFPQGGRKQTFEDSKAGVGFLAKKTGVPIIAARVFGTEKILPKGARFPKFGQVRVGFKEVSYQADVDSYEEIAAKVIATIQEIN